jgi:hypothetical protein
MMSVCSTESVDLVSSDVWRWLDVGGAVLDVCCV